MTGNTMKLARALQSKTLIAVSTVALISATSCSSPKESPDTMTRHESNGERPVVYVVNYPLQYFAQRIGGDLIEVHFPAPGNVDPAFWKPAADIVSRYQQADLVLLNGASYAKWLETATLSDSRLVNTTSAIQDQYIRLSDATIHSHGPEGEHTHTGTAFTTWMDPGIAIIQATTVAQAIKNLLPSHAIQLSANYAALERDLMTLDQRLEAIVSRDRDLPLVASHPVYQYLQRRFELNLTSVHWEPDEPPNEDMCDQLTDLLQKHPAKWMIWESSPLDDTVARLAAIKVDCAGFDPCGNVPDNGDFVSVFRQNLDHLDRVFSSAGR